MWYRKCLSFELDVLEVWERKDKRCSCHEADKYLKKKDSSSSGTASPQPNQSPAGSGQATPTGSTSNLVDARSKSLSGSDGPNQTHPGAPNPGPPGMSTQQTPSLVPPHSSYSGSGGANAGLPQGGPNTPGRHGGMNPSVVISPSAPVSQALCTMNVQQSFIDSDRAAHPSSRRSRDNAA